MQKRQIGPLHVSAIGFGWLPARGQLTDLEGLRCGVPAGRGGG